MFTVASSRPNATIRALAAIAWVAVTANVTAARTAEQRATDLVAKMTRDEKISLAVDGKAGVARVGIPPLVFRDGPNGVGEGATYVTAFPNAEVVAASW